MTSITLTIPDNKLAEFKEGYLRMYPCPSGTNENNWIKEVIIRNIFEDWQRGKVAIARAEITLTDNEIIS